MYRPNAAESRSNPPLPDLRGFSILIILWMLFVPGWVWAQEAEFTLNVDVDLVELNVSVLDPTDRLVVGLEAGDFEIFEDQVRQEVSLFLHEDRPVSLGFVIDNSRSMELKKERVDAAALTFLNFSNPQDEVFLIHFADAVRLAEDFTSDVGAIEKSLARMAPYGQTAMFDALMSAVGQIQQGRYDGRAILLVSDGADNASATAYEDALEAVRRSGVAVYPIGVLSDSPAGREARTVLESFALASGGRAFFPQSADEIPALTERIARELRELYTLGYVPTNAARDGAWRSVRVHLRPPLKAQPMRLHYRHGYYAPGRH